MSRPLHTVIATSIATCLACGLATVGPVVAQPAGDSLLRAGARVRVVDSRSRMEKVTGTFVRRHGDTIVIVRRSGATELFPMQPRHRLDVGIAQPNHVVRYTFTGVATGAVVGAAVGAVLRDLTKTEHEDYCVPISEWACLSGSSGDNTKSMWAVFAGVGAAIGGFAGAIKGNNRLFQWVPVERDVQVSFAPVNGGAAMTVRVPIGRATH